MATYTLRPSSDLTTSWAAIGALARWEEIAQETLEKAGEPGNANGTSTARGIHNTANAQGDSIIMPGITLAGGETVVSITLHVYGKATAAGGFSAGFKSTGMLSQAVEPAGSSAGWLSLAHTEFAKYASGTVFSVSFTSKKAAEQFVYCAYIVVVTETAAAPVTIPLAAASSVSAASLALTAAPTIPLAAGASVSSAELALTAGPLLPFVAAGSVSAAALALTAGPTVPLAAAVSVSAASLGVTAGPTLPLVAAGSVSAAALGLTAGAGRIPLAPASSSSATSLALRAAARLLLESASSTSGATLVLTTGHVVGESFSAGGFPSGDAAGGVSAGRPGAGGSSSLAWGAAGGSAAAGSAGAGGSVGRMFSTGGGS